MNKAILDSWVKEGYAIYDCGDGAWTWTSLGKQLLPSMTRTLLSVLLYEEGIPSYMKQDVINHGFDEEGFVLTDGE